MLDDETFAVALGGRRWELPHLPWGAVRKLQPRLLRFNAGFRGVAEDEAGVRVDEAALQELTEIVALALRQVDVGVTTETLDALPIRPAELILAQIAIMNACGMEVRAATAEDSDPKA